MPFPHRLVVLERDIAVSLSRVDAEEDALRAVLDALSDFEPEGGAAVRFVSGSAEAEEAAGPLAAAALEALDRRRAEAEDDLFRYSRALDAGSGSSGALAFVSERDPRTQDALEVVLERAASLLSATLGRIGGARSLDYAAKDQALLVRELRHRTRNSLHLIKDSILILVGTISCASAEVLDAIDERLEALVAVHDMLSWTNSSELVSAEGYFLRLAESLRRVVPEGIGTLIAYYDAAEDVRLPVDKAATIGLIVHELVMNTAKHSGGRQQRMSVRVDRSGGALVVGYAETPAASSPAAPRPRAEPAAGGGGHGLEIVRALLARIGGRRIDDGTDVGNFVAAFPIG